MCTQKNFCILMENNSFSLVDFAIKLLFLQIYMCPGTDEVDIGNIIDFCRNL